MGGSLKKEPKIGYSDFSAAILRGSKVKTELSKPKLEIYFENRPTHSSSYNLRSTYCEGLTQVSPLPERRLETSRNRNEQERVNNESITVSTNGVLSPTYRPITNNTLAQSRINSASPASNTSSKIKREVHGIPESTVTYITPRVFLSTGSASHSASTILKTKRASTRDVIYAMTSTSAPHNAVAPKPRLKTDPKTRLKTVPKPRLKTDPNPRLKTDPKLILKTDPKLILKTDPKLILKSDPKPNLQCDPRPYLKSDSKPTLKNAQQTILKTYAFPGTKVLNQSNSLSSNNQIFQKGICKNVPKVIIVTANFGANNYLIPTMIPQNYTAPEVSAEDCEIFLNVCPQYNSKLKCSFVHCRRFHVCYYYWIGSNCKNNNCLFDHAFNCSDHNSSVLKNITNLNKANFQDSLKKSSINFRVPMEDYICTGFIANRNCNSKRCKSEHIDWPYMWQIRIDETWMSLPRNQVYEIEKYFWDPNNASATLPGDSIHSSNFRLDRVIGSERFTVDFEKLSLITSSSFFRIRRLSTPSDIMISRSEATRWIWYWLDDGQVWQKYSFGFANKCFVTDLSDYLEFLFLKGTKEFKILTIGIHRYSVNLHSMVQVNLSTMKNCPLRRRPISLQTEKWDDNTTFQSLWSTTKTNNLNFQRIAVSTSSPEHIFVRRMLLKSLPTIKEINVERIENHFLWESYQLKKKQLCNKYNGDTKALDEQYLFHGTNNSAVDKICSEGFDWRLFGTNVGNVYGRGTYFSNKASLSDSYASNNNNENKCMFVSLVLVGSATVGASSMDIPPINPNTGKRFDTTVDSPYPEVFVKYNMDEYYSAYCVSYK